MSRGLESLKQTIESAIDADHGVDWAISIRDTAGHEVLCHNGNHAMKTASVGKLLLLVEVARECVAGELGATTLLARDPRLHVADSGLWQHLHVDELSVHDLCVLIAGVSDNLATNVVLKQVGLQRVAELADSLGLERTALLDYVRDHRGPGDPPTLSTGSASELSGLMTLLARDALISPAVSGQVNAWLATGVDLSMVASAFGLDPLAHTPSDRNMVIRNKTGADPGIRAEVGTVERGEKCLSYAVIANWEGPDLRDPALRGMAEIGAALRTEIEDE